MLLSTNSLETNLNINTHNTLNYKLNYLVQIVTNFNSLFLRDIFKAYKLTIKYIHLY